MATANRLKLMYQTCPLVNTKEHHLTVGNQVSNHFKEFTFNLLMLYIFYNSRMNSKLGNPKLQIEQGGTVAQSVECATPGEEVPGSIPAAGHPPNTGWVVVSI